MNEALSRPSMPIRRVLSNFFPFLTVYFIFRPPQSPFSGFASNLPSIMSFDKTPTLIDRPIASVLRQCLSTLISFYLFIKFDFLWGKVLARTHFSISAFYRPCAIFAKFGISTKSFFPVSKVLVVFYRACLNSKVNYSCDSLLGFFFWP